MSAAPRRLDPKLKYAVEFGPLLLFFLAYWKFKIFVATGVMMVAVLVALGVSYWKLGRLPLMPKVTAVIVILFGSTTLIFHDDTLFKIKTSVLYGLFAGALFYGLAAKRPMLQVMFDGVLHLTEEGWRILTWRWAFFFLCLAGLNEAIWRTQSTDVWAAFKAFGIIPLTFVFALAQTPVILKHETKETPAEETL